MASHLEIVTTFIEEFEKVLIECPIVSRSFYNSFEFTRTGNNLSHPRTLGLLVKACNSLSEVVAVDVDVHLNAGSGVKFQPDLVAWDKDEICTLIVDFESPNSSDARIPGKDVQAYAKWIDFTKCEVPYLIITSLPKVPKGKWKLRMDRDGCNREHREFVDQIKSSPFTYWYGVYREELEKLSKQYHGFRELPLFFANLDGVAVHLIDPWVSQTV